MPSVDKTSVDKPSLEKPSAEDPSVDEPLLDVPSLDEPLLDEPSLGNHLEIMIFLSLISWDYRHILTGPFYVILGLKPGFPKS